MVEDRGLEYFCCNVRILRDRERLSKKEMAKILGVGVKMVTMIENGIIPPRLDCRVLFCIYRRFGIKPAELLRSVIER